ncbi:hypothetical protein BG004_005353 [Podila humilis]|nr:hypothetical protein BG004_005353 [Podila humilis]
MSSSNSDQRFINDHVLKSIARELEHTVADGVHKSAQSSNNKRHRFHLQSFLTNPKRAPYLFPGTKRYKSIHVHERLVLLSVSTEGLESNNGGGGGDGDDDDKAEGDSILIAGVEVLEYTLVPSATTTTTTTLCKEVGKEKEEEVEETNKDDPKENHNEQGKTLLSVVAKSVMTTVPERIIYIAKVDTSGYWPLPNIDTQSMKTSPVQALIRGYLKAIQSYKIKIYSRPTESLGSPPKHPSPQPPAAWEENNAKDNAYTSASERASAQLSAMTLAATGTATTKATTICGHHPPHSKQIWTCAPKTSLYIFARAQPQYLFAKSAKNPRKRALDDRKLIGWWKYIVETSYQKRESQDRRGHLNDNIVINDDDDVEGFVYKGDETKRRIEASWHIPGIESERQAIAMTAISRRQGQSGIHQQQQQSQQPATPATIIDGWSYGHSYKRSTTVEGGGGTMMMTMARDVIPQFPDDPKSRMIRSGSCANGAVDVNTFWELVAIGEECGAGKCAGFFRVVEEASPLFLIGVKGDEKNRDAMEERLNEGDGVQKDGENVVVVDRALPAQGTTRKKPGSGSDYTNVINTLLELDFSTMADSVRSTRAWHVHVRKWISQKEESEEAFWIQDHALDILLPLKASDSAGQGEQTSGASTKVGPTVVNVLGAGMIKRKESPRTTTATPTMTTTTTTTTSAINMLGSGLIKRKESLVTTPVGAVNVLGANMIKRKLPPNPVPTSASASNTSISAPATAEATAEAAELETLSNGPVVVNILGSNLIKRKIIPSPAADAETSKKAKADDKK